MATILLAGCAGPPRPNLTQVPDWESSIPVQTRMSSPPETTQPPFRKKEPTTAAQLPSQTPPGNRNDSRSWSAGAASVPWVPLDRWARENGVGAVSQLAGGVAPCYSLTSDQGRLVLCAGSLVARLDGYELRLGFAPQQIDQKPFVHALDLGKTIQPLLENTPLVSSGNIVIDPGHGGGDSGAHSVLGGACEKDFALDWALRLRKVLAEQGWNVSLTRSTDIDCGLTNRVIFAGEHRAALFLSLHFNSAAPNHSEAGVETYCLTPAGMASNLTRGYSDDPSQVFPNNAFDSENIALAVRIHRALVEANGRQDRGVRRARFPAVLRGQQCPAVLLEGGYLSNPDEARLIASSAYRQQLAEAVGRALRPTSYQR